MTKTAITIIEVLSFADTAGVGVTGFSVGFTGKTGFTGTTGFTGVTGITGTTGFSFGGVQEGMFCIAHGVLRVINPSLLTE